MLDIEKLKEIIDRFLSDPNNRGKIDKLVGRYAKVFADNAANHYKEVYLSHILFSGMGATAKGALSELEQEKIRFLGEWNNGKGRLQYRYLVGINIAGDLSRPSLCPGRYSGIDNIAALLNNGYAAGNTVLGLWEGHGYIESLQVRQGESFIPDSVRDYMSSYAKADGVVSATYDDSIFD